MRTEDVPIPLFALQQAEHSLGVKSEGVTIDPILLLQANKITPVPEHCEPTTEQGLFDDTYLRPGSSYTVIFGGSDAGTATIKPEEGDFVDTRVQLSKPVPIYGLNMALAGPRILARKSGLRRDLDSDESRMARHTAEEILAAKGVNRRDIRKLFLHQAIAIELSPDVTQILVSARIDRPDGNGVEYSLSFAADDRDGGNHSTLWYQHAQSETEAEALYTVDVVDLDGDGVNELVARRVFYENYKYEVYKREKSGWEKIFSTGILGCE